MLKHVMAQFGQRKTTKFDVIIGIGAAIFAIGHAVDTAKQYKTENDPTENQENTK